MDRADIARLIDEKMRKAMPYQDFKELTNQMAVNGKTTGQEQTASLIQYTVLNSRRMKRWDKTFRIPNATAEIIKTIDRPIIWLVLTESWCGDAAPTIPVMNKIAELNPNIHLGILLRDDHLDLMERFRTEGALSIPKLISMDRESGEIIGEWGPRPLAATRLVKEYKEKHEALTPEFREELQRWYNADKGLSTLHELLKLLSLE